MSSASAVNASGQVVGWASAGAFPNVHAFHYHNGVKTDLGTLGGPSSQACGISILGQIVGQSDLVGNGGSHAFLYYGGVMKDLNAFLPAGSGWTLTTASAINNFGQIVGYGDHNGSVHAFLLTPSAPTLTGMSLAVKSVKGGTNTYGYVTISTPSPANVPVSLKSSNTAVASAQGTVVLAGLMGEYFAISTKPVTTTTLVTITASLNGTTKTATLTVTPLEGAIPPSHVKAWGSNHYWQLGDGTNVDKNAPVNVANLTNVVAIAAGRTHTLALKQDGTVWAWGANPFGPKSYGTLGNIFASGGSAAPVNVTGLSNVSAIAAGRYTSLALADGFVYAWGCNVSGELGIGVQDSNKHETPVKVVGLSNVKAIAIGSTLDGANHCLALLQDGSVYAWGNNGFGQQGDGTYQNNRFLPKKVLSLPVIVAIACGNYHSLALNAKGGIWAWGRNNEGQLGCGVFTNSLPFGIGTPVRVTDYFGAIVTGFKTIAAGGNHSLAVASDSSIWAWGENGYGQLGMGTSSNTNVASQVYNASPGFVDVAGGDDNSAALGKNGTVWVWGRNSAGQLGYEIPLWAVQAYPKSIWGLTQVRALKGGLAGGNSHVVVLVP